MARTPKAAGNLQVFNGSLPKPDVFAQNSGSGCCGNADVNYDKLGERVRFDNGLAHLNPTGGVDRFSVPGGNGFSGVSREIIDHINAVGVGATISVLAIPTYAFLTGVGVHVAAEEAGLTFNLITRNGLVIPTAWAATIEAEAGDAGCSIDRTITVHDPGDGETPVPFAGFTGFGALGTNLFVDIIGRNGNGEFSLEADELILQVATMPASGKVNGTFDIKVTASYDVVNRAEQ